MNESIVYHIIHINLNNPSHYPSINKEKGNYLVFWWNEIPLGDLYLDHKNTLKEDEYLDHLIAAIRTTIEFYSKNNSALRKIIPWENYLKDGQFDLFSIAMENVFSSAIIKKHLPEVPVSIVICTRNRAQQLKTCLKLLQKLSCQAKEILVIDNAPIDNSTFETVAEFERVKYIKEPRIGLNIARNTGLINAKYPIVAYVDDDVIVDSMWVYRVHETFQDSNIAAMTGLVIAAELDTVSQVIFEKNWSFNRGYIDKMYDKKYMSRTLSQGPPVWEIGAGANMAFRKNVFKEVGLFDDILDVGAAGCNGDSEMWFRILLAGHAIVYNPRAVVYHEHRKEMSGLKQQIFYYMRGFTAAAFLQQDQEQKAGYRKHVSQLLTKYYFPKAKNAIFNNHPNNTVWQELKGILSGLKYYIRNKKKSTRFTKL